MALPCGRSWPQRPTKFPIPGERSRWASANLTALATFQDLLTMNSEAHSTGGGYNQQPCWCVLCDQRSRTPRIAGGSSRRYTRRAWSTPTGAEPCRALPN